MEKSELTLKMDNIMLDPMYSIGIDIGGITDYISVYMIEKTEQIYLEALRNNAMPPIRGEITTGKIKWRGIKLVSNNDFMNKKMWVEQRGKRISQIISIDGVVVK